VARWLEFANYTIELGLATDFDGLQKPTWLDTFVDSL